MTTAIRIIGAGPTGALLAILLQRRGLAPIELYEARPDPKGVGAQSGRSINLALADRGIQALKSAGVFEALGPTLLPMRGRLIHDERGETAFQPYGQRANEVIYSVSRHRLNQALIEVAVQRAGIRIFFEHRFETADFAAGTAQIHDLRNDRRLTVAMQPMLATDGAGSLMRRAMSAQNLIQASETDLEHGYKELSIPPAPSGNYPLAAEALHIWPRGGYMMIALPNEDGSFTATLFLPKHGPVSFESLDRPQLIGRFLAEEFPDAHALMPDSVAEFAAHPVGFLGTVSARPWHFQDRAALIGDSAHAMVPFHGQGMNCCFEDCIEFDDCMSRNGEWGSAFAEFGAARKPNTDAIAAMALENYLEMREQVADAKFQLQQALALELERRFPRRFIPRYSMVMFHHEIPYHVALERGITQSRILRGLTHGSVHSLADVNFQRAEQEILAKLPPF
jgi:kynurenine 3-monooxygenase